MTRVGPTRRGGDCDTSVGTAEGRDDGKKTPEKNLQTKFRTDARVGIRVPIVDTRQGQMRQNKFRRRRIFEKIPLSIELIAVKCKLTVRYRGNSISYIILLPVFV